VVTVSAPWRSIRRIAVSFQMTRTGCVTDNIANGRGGGVLDNTAGAPSASCGLPARVRSER
jgi:hypothetical protein